MKSKKKILVILGPTSSGKSELAVELARKFLGEVISADSRQVYRGLDVGTGKITKDEMDGVPHHLIDVADVDEKFSAADFKRLAEDAIHTIYRMNRLPIVAGGTGFYIQALVDDVTLPEVPPDEELRESLAKLPPAELLEKLRGLDSKRAENIEQENPRRLIRAIEIATKLGKVPNLAVQSPSNEKYDVLQIGLKIPENELKERIEKRVKERIQKGMIEEAKDVPKERLRELGLGYKCVADFFEEKISKEELEKCVIKEEQNYAKRQMRWFKRDPRIKWFGPENTEKIEKEVKRFIKT